MPGRRRRGPTDELMTQDQWTAKDSRTLYNVSSWGRGYFGIHEQGHVIVAPDGELSDEGSADCPHIDLLELIRQIKARGVEAPLLLRFDGILRARVRKIQAAFDTAREQYGYGAPYRGVFPVKVNQDRHVVETLLEAGRETGLGLEVGSKPELFAALALQTGGEMLMICNGYKDAEYVEIALLASQLGITPVIVVEKLTELQTILDASERLSIRPVIGIRSKLTFRGSGRWQQSVGDRSKFGLTPREIVEVVERLRERELLDCLSLLHFHIGSQISNVRSFKSAMSEATNVLVGLTRMGAHIRWFDAGGGLGVDYDGSRTTFDSSMNYSLQEYANEIVYDLYEACREADIEEPVILTESGRALVAHHALLVGEVIGVSSLLPDSDDDAAGRDDHTILESLSELEGMVTRKTYQECYHDAVDLRDQARMLFSTGQLDLAQRARADEYFWRACRAILAVTRQLEYVTDDLADLENGLSDTYFVNFSIFQSMPDSWAIQHVFPVMPLQRLDERPTRRGVVADLTCDSDGKLDRFIDLRDVKRTLELHSLSPQGSPSDGQPSRAPYYLGFFLVGAYQEILGDMHNLFGDTNVVHVDLDDEGNPQLTHVMRGDRVQDVLSYVHYYEEDLLRSLRRHVEAALKAGRMSYEESARFWKRYEAGLRGYTYLTPGDGRNVLQPTPPAEGMVSASPSPSPARTPAGQPAESESTSL